MERTKSVSDDTPIPVENKQIKEPIAIVGMSCRFPQANSLNAFWELLKNGVDTIKEIPSDRWNLSDYYDPDPSANRKTYQRYASMLENIHDFDPFFFNISPAEASEMNPSQKLMLELAWEAFESSTIPIKDIQGRKVGVYVGSIWSDYQHLRKHKNAPPTSHSSMGQSSDLIANRISFAFGFTGPSLILDTGCSSSLVALNFACQSLWDGTNEMALSGGINILLDPDQYILLSKFGGLSMKGKCSTFDAEADGFVRGEGAGLLVLKRLSDAEKNGDKIFAVIRGTAVNNNGFNVNLPATSVDGQLQVLEEAYHHAGIKPNEVHYVEAHGTGTKLGDPTEAKALGEFFKKGRDERNLLIGSVKTNIGHTEATAGIAGLIKVVLAMQHKVLPPSLNFKTPNPEIPFETLKLKVNDSLNEWPVSQGETLKAGVNSFGWGGTNAHAVIEEYVSKQDSKPFERRLTRYCLPLSAKSSAALKAYAKAYIDLLSSSNESQAQEICIASAILKPNFEYKALFSGASNEELINNLQEFVDNENEILPTQSFSVDDKIVFVFPGQGSQWLGMGRELFEQEKVFRDTMEACDKAFNVYTDWSLIDQLYATPEKSRLEEINVIQPFLFAVQVALAKFWMSLGIKPHAVVGHSMGEVAAAYVSGVLSLEDAACVICTRSALMKKVSGKGGAMAVTELTIEQAEKVLERYPHLSIAVSNSPKSTVLAGDKNSIDALLTELEDQGLFCKPVKVDVASHSQQMDPLKEDLHSALIKLKPQAGVIKIHSTVMNRLMQGEEMTADYWVNNLRGTVQFSAVMETLMRDSHTTFIEVSPHPVLTNAINECAEYFKARVITVGSLLRNKPEHESFYMNVSDLYSKGFNIKWKDFYQTETIPFVSLPGYVFQRERYVLEDKSSELDSKNSSLTYPLLGNFIQLADVFNTYFWETHITLDKFPYLKDKRMNDMIVFPEAAYIEMLLEASSEIHVGCLPAIENLSFIQPVLITDEEPLHLQLKMRKVDNNHVTFQFYRKNNVNEKKSSWGLIAEGDLSIYSKHQASAAIPYIAAPEKTVQREKFYNLLQSLGVTFGEYFQGLHELRSEDNITTFKIIPDQRFQQWATKYRLHPALLDTFFQPLWQQIAEQDATPCARSISFTSMRQIDYFGGTDYQELHGFVTFVEIKKNSEDVINFQADIAVFNADSPVMQIKGLKGQSVRSRSNEIAGAEQQPLTFLERLVLISKREERIQAIEQLVINHVSKIIKTSSARIKPTMTFKGVGIDSLMAIQLRNLLEKDLFVKLSVGMFWAHPSIHEYALYLKDVLTEHIINEEASGSTIDKGQKFILKETQTQHLGTARWFVIPKPNLNAKVRLFCFHDAGGNADLFHGWEHLLGDSIEVASIELPGRGRRISEKPYRHVSDLIADLMPQLEMMLDKPYFFVGHSMGGLIAFETIRELRKRNKTLPQKLFISSTAGLTSYTKNDVDYRLSNEELVQMYPHLAIEKIGDSELQQLLINILRADLELIYNYDYAQQELLDIPIIAIHGMDDERVKHYQIEQWEKETTASFKLISRPGGHRYIEHDGLFLASLIQEVANKRIILVA